MKLYLIRHGIAVNRDAPAVLDDRLRELTPQGITKMSRNADALAHLGLVIDEIWTSPLIRARQTADIIARRFETAGNPRIVKALGPGEDNGRLLQRLARFGQKEGVALIGHEPNLGLLTTYLLTGSSHEAVVFRKGGAACIEVECFQPTIRARLQWLLTPKQMKMMT